VQVVSLEVQATGLPETRLYFALTTEQESFDEHTAQPGIEVEHEVHVSALGSSPAWNPDLQASHLPASLQVHPPAQALHFNYASRAYPSSQTLQVSTPKAVMQLATFSPQ
jgi:hypothetical protein